MFRVIFVLCAIPMTIAAEWGESHANGDRQDNSSESRQWGETVDGQAVSIGTNKASFDPGEAICLNIVFRNVGQRDLNITEVGAPMDYRIKVLLASGKEAPMTLLGKRAVAGFESAARNIFVLQPGKETHTQFRLDRIFDFSLDGKYTIVVDRYVWHMGRDEKEVTKTVVTSNRITISTSDPGPPFKRLFRDERW